MENRQVIAAYSGGTLPAAIGVVRMSGQGAIDILGKIFAPKSGKVITDCDTNTMIYGELSASDGKTLDICMASFFRGPKSYTGEDMAEIYCHGSEAIVAAALRAICAHGGRLAQAGEFTKRAFLNGKMDLSQAEAVADLIYSRTEWSAKNAAALLKGQRYRELEDMRSQLLELIAHFYAVCDYSDEDIEPFEYQRAGETLEDICRRLDSLYQGYLRSNMLASGVPVAVIGRPNVGKSSLFNALAGFQRAIVTEEAGTTRDVVGHRVFIGGRDLELLDTAGIRQGESKAEVMGIDRSRQAAQEAALIVAVFDGSQPLTAEDREIVEICREKPTLAVINKSDITICNRKEIETAFHSVLEVSAKEGTGVQAVAQWLADQAAGFDTGEALITSQRQADLIKGAHDALKGAVTSAQAGMTADAFLLDAEQGARLIGQILGLDVDLDITEGIFSRFCVGK